MRFGVVYDPGSCRIHEQATNSYIGSRATLQGYSVSHYTFLVYKRPFPSTCEVTVHSVAPLMAYSFEYPEHLWTNYTKALHVTLTCLTCFCTSRHDNNFCQHSHPRVHSFQILISSTSTLIQVWGLQGTYPLRMFFLLDTLNSLFCIQQEARGLHSVSAHF